MRQVRQGHSEGKSVAVFALVRKLGRMLGGPFRHRCALARQIVRDRLGEAWVGQVMGRMGDHRPIAAGDFMLALRAGLDALVAAADRKFDRLIVADLEVEKRQRFQRAPIAPVDGVVAQKIDRSGDMPSRRDAP